MGYTASNFKTKMNVLNEEIIDFVKTAMPFVEENGVGLVIGNQAGGVPGAFSAGADLKFMGRYAMQGQWDKVEAFLDKAQKMMTEARYSHVPIVAAPYGLTFGGGCEICLGAADRTGGPLGTLYGVGGSGRRAAARRRRLSESVAQIDGIDPRRRCGDRFGTLVFTHLSEPLPWRKFPVLRRMHVGWVS